MVTELGLVDAEVNGRMKRVDYIGRLQRPIKATETEERYILS
jgi:hypothetical protein